MSNEYYYSIEIDQDEVISNSRFDAKFYSSDSMLYEHVKKQMKKEVVFITMKEATETIFWPGRFKRHYENKKNGDPFLMPVQVFDLLPVEKKYIINYPTNLKGKKDWIYITRSGTVGRSIIGTEYLEKFILSDDLIRVVPKKDDNLLGYLYIYLNTTMGKTLLCKNKYGAVINHIEPEHVENIEVPIFAELKQEINETVYKINSLRGESQKLLSKSINEVYVMNNIENVYENDYYFGNFEETKRKGYEINYKDLNNRFDASNHLPVIDYIYDQLNTSKCEIYKLEDLSKSIFIPPRFKRPYVNKEEIGKQYIRPSDLPLIKTLEKLYLYKSFTNHELFELKTGQILIVTDGTIGWVSIVTQSFHGCFGSNNFARVEINKDFHKGYLLSFLMTCYGQLQLKKHIYGGVIDHLEVEHLNEILIPVPEHSIQKKIGDQTILAFEQKDEANILEQELIIKFNKYIEKYKPRI